MSEKTSKKSDDHAESRKDQYTIVLEQLNSQFKAFGESLVGFREKTKEGFDQIDRRFDQVDMRFLKLEGRFDGLGGKFDKFEAKTEENFKIVKKYLSNITDDLDRIATEIKEMKSEPKKIDFGRVAELEREVKEMKREIAKQGKLIQLKLCA
jgi:hypothetical protein